MHERSVNVFIADCQPVFVDGLVWRLGKCPGYKVVGTACSLDDARRKLSDCSFDLVLADTHLPEPKDGLELMRLAQDMNPRCKVAALSISDNFSCIEQANKAGADAYLSKMSDFQEIADSLDTIVSGGKPPLKPELEAALWQKLCEDQNLAENRLSERERAILELISQGVSDKDIAEKLGITINAVRQNISRIMQKLGVKNRTRAVVVAIRNGVI